MTRCSQSETTVNGLTNDPGKHRLHRLVVGAVIAVVLVAAGYFAGYESPAWAGGDDTGQTDQAQPGFVDVRFLQGMSMHHHQAVLMSLIALNSGDPVVRRLATSIAISQARQAGQMRGWLDLWNKPQDAMMSKWIHRYSGNPKATRMPGMATPKELQKLRTLSGKPFDVMFLQLMLRHHLGGIQMAQYAYKHANLKKVRRVAHAEAIQQIKEAARMQSMLKMAGAKPLPFP